MLKIILLLSIGLLGGVLLRGKNLNWLPKVTSLIVMGLLFSLGSSIGGNKIIMSGIKNIGSEALIITSAAIIGSIIIVGIASKLLFKNR